MGVVAAWTWQYGLTPVMQGPLAIAMNDTDFSWLSGSLVAGGLYYVLHKNRTPSRHASAPAEPVPS